MNQNSQSEFQRACRRLPEDQRTPGSIRAFKRAWSAFHALRLGVKRPPCVGDGYQLPGRQGIGNWFQGNQTG